MLRSCDTPVWAFRAFSASKSGTKSQNPSLVSLTLPPWGTSAKRRE